MPQPNMGRQNSIDTSRSRSAMKVLEKYCRRKYRTSTVLTSPMDFDYPSEPSTPTSQSSMFLFPGFGKSRQSNIAGDFPDRPTSTFFASDSRGPLSARTMSDFLEIPIKEEIRQRPQETRVTYFWRVLKFLYRHLRLHHIVIVTVVILYSLLGGALFSYFEVPEEARRHELLIKAAKQRHQAFSNCFCSMNCESWLEKFGTFPNATNYRLTRRSEEACIEEMKLMLGAYDTKAGFMPIGKRVWAWDDYWNAVFYAWTLLTTIGYGNLTCHTREGRILTMFYSLAGIPLMLIALQSIGEMMFYGVRYLCKRFQTKAKKTAKYLRMRLFKKSMKGLSNDKTDEHEKQREETAELSEENEEEEEMDIIETFPIKLALAIVFAYISICSLIFKFWEEWDYMTSFYFFFISLSTIGLGDEIPEHPRYACAFFFFFVIGLSLVSMCVSIMQKRVENRYMAALQLIDEEHRQGIVETTEVQEPQPESPRVNDTDVTTDQPKLNIPRPTSLLVPASGPGGPMGGPGPGGSGVKWRRPPMRFFQIHATTSDVPFHEEVSPQTPHTPNTEEASPKETTIHTPRSLDLDSAPRSPFCRLPSSSTLSVASSGIMAAPPVLRTLISRRRSTRRCRQHPLLRSDSIRNAEESRDELTPLNESRWHPTSPRTPSAPHSPLAHRTSVMNAPLSVITEASDEEVREQLQKKFGGRVLKTSSVRPDSASSSDNPTASITTQPQSEPDAAAD